MSFLYSFKNIKLLAVGIIYLLCSTGVHAALVVNGTNDFMSYTNVDPANNIKPLMCLSYKWENVFQIVGDNIESFDTIQSAEGMFIKQPLVYPSPLRINDGGFLGYSLSRDDIDLELRIYDMFGYEVIRKEYTHNSTGAFLGYNRLTLDADFFESKPVAAGVYFYVFISDGELLGKGKFAVAP